MASLDDEGRSIDRRRFVFGAAGAVASACVVGSLHGSVAAASSPQVGRGLPPAPKPIPGGLPVPLGDDPRIHVWGPGDPAISLPYSGNGFPLGGFDVEPSTITDFRGSSALAYHAGTARGSDGTTYLVETDMRAFEGDYVVDGVTRRGAFALV